MRNQQKIQEKTEEKVSDQNMFCNSGRNLREKRMGQKPSRERQKPKPEGRVNPLDPGYSYRSLNLPRLFFSGYRENRKLVKLHIFYLFLLFISF